jgi:hypothetical protein
MHQTPFIKNKVCAPGLVRMVLSDRTEACNSKQILPALRRHFNEVEYVALGGTILMPLFSAISENFYQMDETTCKQVEYCIEQEAAWIAAGEIESDFMFGVYRK